MTYLRRVWVCPESKRRTTPNVGWVYRCLVTPPPRGGKVARGKTKTGVVRLFVWLDFSRRSPFKSPLN